MKNTAQLSIISLSGILLIGVVFFSIDAASELGSTYLFAFENDYLADLTVPVNYEPRIAKGNSLAAAGYYSLAATEYALAINIQEENPEAYTKLGNTYLTIGDTGKAVEQYKLAVDLTPWDTDTLIQYGKALIHNKQFDEAGDVLYNLPSDTQEGFFYSGMLKAYFGEHDTAHDQFTSALGLGGSYAPTTIQNFINAFDEVNEMVEGDNSYLSAMLIEAYIDTEEFQLAEALALRVLNETNDYRDVWILLGYAQLQTEQYQSAEEAFKQAKTLDSIKPETHYFLGTAHYFQKEYEEAVEALELALLYGFQPEEEAYRKMAESHLFLEQYEDALESYEFLIKLNPSDINMFVRPIWISIDVLGDLNRALSLAEEAVSYFPSEAMSHNLLAWVYLERNEVEQADAAIEIAFSIDPNLAEAHFNAGRIRELQGNLEGAKWEYKRAHELAKSGDSISKVASEKYNELLNQEKEE